MYRHYNPAHSDFLIHWTGRDIDQEHDPDWTRNHSSNTPEYVTRLYIDRLKSILKFGLWMTKNIEDQYVEVKGEKFKRPFPARTCFTELKLSSVRSHASEYGRLGIGFKRFFLLDRLGAPMTYYQPDRKNWFFPPYIPNRKDYKDGDYFACFLKPMTKKSSDSTLEYKFYDESEWRIIYSDDIEKKLKNIKQDGIGDYFIRPSNIKDNQFQEIVKKSRNVKPEYLIPIKDRWFCMIIYPSLLVKVEAESDIEIRSLLDTLKPQKASNSRHYKNPAPLEKNSKPIEIDLDACRNF